MGSHAAVQGWMLAPILYKYPYGCVWPREETLVAARIGGPARRAAPHPLPLQSQQPQPCGTRAGEGGGDVLHGGMWGESALASPGEGRWIEVAGTDEEEEEE